MGSNALTGITKNAMSTRLCANISHHCHYSTTRGVRVDEERGGKKKKRKKKFDTYTRNLNFAFEVISRKETRVKKKLFF